MINLIKIMRNKIHFKRRFNSNVNSHLVSRNIILGEQVQIGKNSVVGSNVSIDSYTYLNTINGIGPIVIEPGTKIGKFCSIAPNVFIGPGNHPIHLLTTHPILFDKHWQKKFEIEIEKVPIVKKPGEGVKTIIGNDVWIGVNTIICGGVTIGDGAIVAAGSIVTKDVEPYSVVAGIPAREIKKRFSDNLIKSLIEKEVNWWDLDKKQISERIHLFYNLEDFIGNQEW